MHSLVLHRTMAAADYYEAPPNLLTDEERLEVQARDIDQRTLLFQAQSRGFLIRYRIYNYHNHNVANENCQPFAAISTRRSRDIQGSFSRELHGIHDNTTTLSIENAEDDDPGGSYDPWQTATPNKAESTYLKARYQELVNGANNGSELDGTSFKSMP